MVPPFFGANGGTRTRDLLITNQLLYRLSHISVCPAFRDTFGIIAHLRRFVKPFFAFSPQKNRNRKKTSPDFRVSIDRSSRAVSSQVL